MTVRILDVVVFAGFVGYALCLGGPRGEYSDEWLMKTSDRSLDVRSLMGKYGFDLVSEPSPGYFVMKDVGARPREIDPAVMRRDKMLAEPKIEYMKQLQYLDRRPRGSVSRQRPRASVPRQTQDFPVNDSHWENMWHVREDQTPSMYVYDVWKMGYTGAGIHSAILDDGVEPTHSDLVDNYNASLSYDYLYDQGYVNHTETDFHGTWCAGIVGAAKNNDCVLGLAYESTFSAVKIFDRYFGLTDLGEALALMHQLEQTDIYSNSWGPSDSGEIFDGPGPLAREGLMVGIAEGRGGRGAIYTWANGNGGPDDDCNCDGYANSIYTISVTSVGRDQGISWYSEPCSSVFVGTYAGDSPDLRIATTDTFNGCTTSFQGTSAACPMATGIIALTLEVRPDLTWRDVQHLIVETSTKDGLIKPDWHMNGARKLVSHVYGFGLMNAFGMVNVAKSWSLVPEQLTCESEEIQVNRISDNGFAIDSFVGSDGCGIRHLEHVQAWLSFNSTYRGSVEITLTSPQGTASRLLHERQWDFFNGSTVWTFMTVMSWGENPTGMWSLHLEGTRADIEYGLTSWKLIQYGTNVDPIFGAAIEEDTSNSARTGAIVGGVVGGVVAFGAVAAVAYFFLKKQKDPTVYPSVK